MSVFKSIPKSEYLFESENFYLIFDKYPVSKGHILIISKKEKIDYFELTNEEKSELTYQIVKAKEIIELNFSPEGYNIGMNCGEVAGQTVMHFHCHVIPRYKGDMDNPKGGIRHCIIGKGFY